MSFWDLRVRMFIGCGIVLLFLLFTGIKSCSDEKDRNTQSSTDNQYSYSDDSYSDDNNYSNGDDDNYTSSGYIGDNYIEIVDYRFGETKYDRDPVIIVTYNYTNYSNEARSYTYSLSDTVYQNGIELEDDLFPDIRNEEIDTSMPSKNIQPGTTITFDKVYVLQNDYDDVDVEVTPFLSSNGSDKVSKTFYLE